MTHFDPPCTSSSRKSAAAADKFIGSGRKRPARCRRPARLMALTRHSPDPVDSNYALPVLTIKRETLLQEVWAKAEQGGRIGEEWRKIAVALDRLFSRNIHWLSEEGTNHV